MRTGGDSGGAKAVGAAGDIRGAHAQALKQGGGVAGIYHSEGGGAGKRSPRVAATPGLLGIRIRIAQNVLRVPVLVAK